MPHLSPPRSATSDSLPRTSQQCWQSSRRAIAIALVSLALSDRPALAQSSIEADTTMGNQPSRVIQNYLGFPVEVITDGAQRGQNLFHSLRDFNVDPGRSAYFIVPNNAVRNIVTRVTGNNLSNISGFLGTFRELPNGGVQIAIPNVNLFLINPNGIIFGSGARLAVGGSFVATTANALQFESLGDFSASQPIPPNELLTINPSAFLFNQLVQQPQNSIESRALLVVPAGRSLLLLGGNTSPTKTASGNILLAGNGIREETGLVASGGRVEVGSVGSVSTVQLLSNGDLLSFKMGDTTARTDISLTNSVGIAVWKSDGGGNLVIDGRNISLSGGSFAVAGILPGGSSPANRAGDVLITATETLNLDNESFIFNRVIPNALGQSGNILITAENLSVRGESQISTSTLGQGNAGDVSVIVRETTVFDGENSSGTSISQAGSSVQPGAAGHAGNLTLTTKNLFLTNGAQLAARTFGQGNAGNLIVTVQETAFFDGTNRAVTSASGIGSTVEPKAIGNGGNTLLTAKNVFVTNGAQILAGTFGQGNAGNLTITVQELAAFDGENQNGITSQAGSGVQPGATGNGGNFNLTARNLLVTNGAGLAASTFGQGNGGSLTITVQETATFDGSTRDGTASSGARSTVEPGATGNGGDFTLATNNLTVTNGAELSVSTFGQGHAGDLTIAVNETASFDGTSRTGTVSSAARSSVESKAVGNGGDLTLHAKNLFVLNGAQLNVSTFGQGNAGNLRITAQQSALFEGTTPSGTVASAAVSAVEPGAIGNGRTIQLSARQLTK